MYYLPTTPAFTKKINSQQKATTAKCVREEGLPPSFLFMNVALMRSEDPGRKEWLPFRTSMPKGEDETHCRYNVE